MRLVEDLDVSEATLDGEERVDLVLGGHDHEVVCRLIGDTDTNPEINLQGYTNASIDKDGQLPNREGNVRIVKSGTDWRSYSIVRLLVGRRQDGSAYLSTAQCKVAPFPTAVTYHAMCLILNKA